MDEEAPLGPSQEVKRRCTSGDVSISTSNQPQTSISPFKSQDNEEMQSILAYCGYTNHEIRDTMHVEHYGEYVPKVQLVVEQVNVF